MSAKEKPRYWWWWFPMFGLDVRDSGADLSEPLFPDASILSPEALLNHFQSSKHELSTMLSNSLEGKSSDYMLDSWVGIRRLLIEGQEEEQLLLASERFLVIAATLGAYCLVDSRFFYSCGPADSVSHRVSIVYATDQSNELFAHQVKVPHPVLFSRHHWKYSRSELKERLLNSRVAKAVQVATGLGGVDSHDSVQKALGLAFRRLAIGMTSDHNGEIVLACWSVFEILLSTGDSPFKTINRRSNLLLPRVDKDLVKTLYELRNKWVHRGSNPDKFNMPTCFGAAFDLMESFAKLAMTFGALAHHQTILDWVDVQCTFKRSAPPGGLAAIHHSFGITNPLEE